MDGRIVCRVMLNSYSKLEDKCRVIDMHIYNTAIHSAFKNTHDTLKEIERLSCEKVSYINTKVIIDQAMARLRRVYEIEQHHIKGISIKQIATTLGASENTIEHRAYRQREKLYAEILERYSGEQLLDVICDSGWLMSMYKRAVKQSQNGKEQQQKQK